MRILTDFTGKGYRMIIELPYQSLAAYETDLKKELRGDGWKEWYAQFQSFVESSEREILKQVIREFGIKHEVSESLIPNSLCSPCFLVFFVTRNYFLITKNTKKHGEHKEGKTF